MVENKEQGPHSSEQGPKGHLDAIMDHPIIRREAGEGWLDGGIDQILLGMLAARESLVTSLAERAQEGGVGATFPISLEQDNPETSTHFMLDDMFRMLNEQITEYKEMHGIGSPPLPPEEE